MNDYVYEGKIIPRKVFQDKQVFPYLPSKELIDAVNLAIYLKKPLLIKGPPGCGKSKLALSVACELGLPYENWYIKSTSRAKDGLYTYDTINRLRDAQLAATGSLTSQERQRFEDTTSYLRLGPLGRAFSNDQRTVILIDEIDKADIDFPNDLLIELDEQIFKVDEVRTNGKEMEISAKQAPIVFITSNDEKDLSDAFLRRCLFHYVQFPHKDKIAQIIQARFPGISDDLKSKAINRFLQLRNLMQEENINYGKNIGTSDLLDWVQALQKENLEKSLAELDKKQLPYLEILLKSWEAHVSYLRLSDDNE